MDNINDSKLWFDCCISLGKFFGVRWRWEKVCECWNDGEGEFRRKKKSDGIVIVKKEVKDGSEDDEKEIKKKKCDRRMVMKIEENEKNVADVEENEGSYMRKLNEMRWKLSGKINDDEKMKEKEINLEGVKFVMNMKRKV